MPTNSGLFEEPPPITESNKNLSPLRMLVVLLILIFMAEMVSMVILYFLQIESYMVEALLDSLIMLVLILPGLNYLHFKPLLKEIDERIRVEQALRGSERLLSKVLELLPVGVWIADKNGKIVHGNPAGQEIWAGALYVGIEQYQEYKAWWADSGERVKNEEWAGSQVIKTRETVLNQELEIEGFDGAHKIILNSAVPIFDEQDFVQGAVIVNQDISKIRQAEQTLIKTNELLERIFFSIDTLIAYMDRDFNFIRVNDTYARTGGHPAEFFIGLNHFALYPNEENQAIFQRVVETGEPYTVFEKAFEYAEFPELGITYWDWSLQPVKGVDGRVEGLVLSLIDVTERKRAELRLERQNEELRLLSIAEHAQRELAEALVQATLALNTSLELEQVLPSILEQIRKAIQFQGASIILLEDHAMRVAAWLGFEAFPNSVPVMERMHALLDDYPLIQKGSASMQPVLIQALNERSDWRKSPGLEWVNSYIAAPLFAGDKMIGIVNLYSEHPGAFTQEAADRLAAFAAPAALALRNAQAYQAEMAARKVVETLSAAIQALSQALDLDYRINTLLDHIYAILHMDTAGLTLLDDELGLVVRARRGYEGWAGESDIPSLFSGEMADAVVQRVRLNKKSFILPAAIRAPGLEGQPDPTQVCNWLVVPIIASDKVIGLVELGKAGSENFTAEHVQWVEAFVGQASILIQNAWLFEQVQTSSERLQSLARKLVEVQENERSHIARELHDEAGQALSSLKLGLGRLEQDPDCPGHVGQRLLELKDLADCVLDDLHRLAMDLRPATLDHLGLVAALEQFARNLSSAQLAVQFKTLGFEGERISPTLETSLYRIVQEALTNVVRYAQASNVGILLERRKDKVRLFVEDNGIGFEPEKVPKSKHLGLVGMRERAEMFGGTLTIESTPDIGTSIIVEVPDVHSDLDRR